MSDIIKTCEEQYLSIEQLLRLAIYCNDDGNKYLNTCDSGLTPEDLLQLGCDEQYPIKGLLRKLIGEDDSLNPCVFFCSTDNVSAFHYVVDWQGNLVVDFEGNNVIVAV